MIQQLLVYIRNISVFLIVMSVCGLILPSDKYKNYVNLILGFILILLIIAPIQHLISNPQNTINSLVEQATNQVDQSDVKNGIIHYSDAQNQLILDTYKKNLNNQIKTIVNNQGDFSYVSSDVSIDTSKDNYGNLLSIGIKVSTEKPKADDAINLPKKSFIKLSPIKITPNIEKSFGLNFGKKSSDNSDNSSQYTVQINNLKKLFLDFYNLSYENINIQVSKN